MKEDSQLIGLVQEPTQRRFWLLHEALRCVPLDRAIELARNAEAFVTGSSVENRPAAARASATNGFSAAPVSAEQVLDAEACELLGIANRPAGNKSGLALSSDQR